MEELERYRILPGYNLFYIPALLPEAEQERLIQKVNASKTWHQLANRRLQSIPSQLLGGTTLLKQALPAYLQSVIDCYILPLGMFAGSPHHAPNHVLVNEYLPGQGIHAHEDGPAYYPAVCTITLGSHCVYHVHDKQDRRCLINLIQEPGSMLVTMNGTYSDYLHSIEEVKVDEDLSSQAIANWRMLSSKYQQAFLPRKTRISLTFRDVLKQKSLVKFGR